MKVIETQTIADAHQKLVEYVYWNGIRMVTEDGQDCIEAEPVTVTIHKPIGTDSEMVHKNSPSGIKKCTEYIKQIFDGAEGFEYTYHERLFHYSYCEEEQYNQIFELIEHLNEERMTRRAVAITWYPWKDPVTQHVPCLQFVQFKIRKRKLGFLHWFIGNKPLLDMYLLFRSEDILGAFGSNAIGLATLQQYVADKIGCEVGKYEHIVTIPHFYPKTNAQELKQMIKC